jgi:hypothetical protein
LAVCSEFACRETAEQTPSFVTAQYIVNAPSRCMPAKITRVFRFSIAG